MMKRKMEKISRLIICLLMVLAFTVPAFAARVAVTVEKLTLGEGFIVAPEFVEISEGGAGAAKLLDGLLLSKGILWQYESTLTSDLFYVTEIDGLVAEGTKGWMVTVNNSFIKTSAGVHTLYDGDVIRWQFTENWGADIGGNPNDLGQSKRNDKDALIWKVAEMNAEGNNSGEEYENALAVLEDLHATAEQIETALNGGGNGGEGEEPPAADIVNETDETTSSSGGGCDAGFGAPAALALALICGIRGREKGRSRINYPSKKR